MSDSSSRPSSPQDQPASPAQSSDSEQAPKEATGESLGAIRYEFWSNLADDGAVEWPYRYLNAQAYPMALGSIIGPSPDQQYKIFDKLGLGGSSTVWLAWGRGEK